MADDFELDSDKGHGTGSYLAYDTFVGYEIVGEQSISVGASSQELLNPVTVSSPRLTTKKCDITIYNSDTSNDIYLVRAGQTIGIIIKAGQQINLVDMKAEDGIHGLYNPGGSAVTCIVVYQEKGVA